MPSPYKSQALWTTAGRIRNVKCCMLGASISETRITVEAVEAIGLFGDPHISHGGPISAFDAVVLPRCMAMALTDAFSAIIGGKQPLRTLHLCSIAIGPQAGCVMRARASQLFLPSDDLVLFCFSCASCCLIALHCLNSSSTLLQHT